MKRARVTGCRRNDTAGECPLPYRSSPKSPRAAHGPLYKGGFWVPSFDKGGIGRISPAESERLHALTGLTPVALAELLLVVLPEVSRYQAQQAARLQRQCAPGAGRKRRLSPAQEVLRVLISLRHTVAHEVVGGLFGVSADTNENRFHELVLILRD